MEEMAALEGICKRSAKDAQVLLAPYFVVEREHVMVLLHGAALMNTLPARISQACAKSRYLLESSIVQMYQQITERTMEQIHARLSLSVSSMVADTLESYIQDRAKEMASCVLLERKEMLCSSLLGSENVLLTVASFYNQERVWQYTSSITHLCALDAACFMMNAAETYAAKQALHAAPEYEYVIVDGIKIVKPSAGGGGRGGAGAAVAEKPKPPEPAKDPLAELAASMHEMHPGTQFDFTGIHPEVAKRVADQVDKLMAKYPDVAAGMDYVGVAKKYDPMRSMRIADENGVPIGRTNHGGMPHYMENTPPMNENSYATLSSYGLHSSMRLNPKWFGKDPTWIDNQLRSDSFKKWHPPNSNLEQVVSHEFGHAVYHQAVNTGISGSIMPWIGRDGTGTPGGVVKWWEQWHKAAGDAVSGYAKYGGVKEAWAEGFAVLENSPSASWPAYVQSQDRLMKLLYPGGDVGWKYSPEWAPLPSIDLTKPENAGKLANYAKLLEPLKKHNEETLEVKKKQGRKVSDIQKRLLEEELKKPFDKDKLWTEIMPQVAPSWYHGPESKPPANWKPEKS